MEKKQNTFEYTYSSKEADEVRSIREKYLTKEPSRKEAQLEALRRLDRQVTDRAMAAAIALGIIGVLIFGFGMSLCLSWNNLALGIPVAAIGAAGTALALPVNNRVLAQERAKAAPQILELSRELLGEEAEAQPED